MAPRKDIASSLVLILFSVVFLVYTRRYPLDHWENPGPAVFPLLLGAALLLLALGQLGHALTASRSGKGAAPAGRTGRGVRPPLWLRFLREEQGEMKVLRMTALLAAYLLAIPVIGFFVSTFAVTLAASRLIERRGRLAPVLLAAGVTLFCYVLFELWLKLSFPRGFLF